MYTENRLHSEVEDILHPAVQFLKCNTFTFSEILNEGEGVCVITKILKGFFVVKPHQPYYCSKQSIFMT